MRACFKHLRLRVILSAPYSYLGAAAELWFSRLKSGDWNPENESTGKK